MNEFTKNEAVFTYTSDTMDKTDFLQKTYLHLLGAVAAFVGLEVLLFKSGIAIALAPVMASNWLVVLGGFMLLGWLTSYFSRKQSSVSGQYIEMGVTILLQALIFIPLLAYAVYYTDQSVLVNSVYATLATFGVLTAIVGYSGKDFSFMGPFLAIIGLAALAAIVASVIFSVTLGFYFSLAMVVFAAATVLYETSKVIHNYSNEQYVAAATALFSSVALLFYYILMSFVNRD